jgi:hypothetical protein
MKKFFLLLTLAAFIIAAPLAMAQGSDTPGAAKPAVGEKGKVTNCCSNGKCKQVSSDADCTKDGGKVVKDCKECK